MRNIYIFSASQSVFFSLVMKMKKETIKDIIFLFYPAMVTKKPAAKKPVAKKPVAKKPAAKKPAAKKCAKKK